MRIISRVADVARFRDRHSVDKVVEEVAMTVAFRLPKRVKLWAVVWAGSAAVQEREADPERRMGYDGPDGIAYKEMAEACDPRAAERRARARAREEATA